MGAKVREYVGNAVNTLTHARALSFKLVAINSVAQATELPGEAAGCGQQSAWHRAGRPENSQARRLRHYGGMGQKFIVAGPESRQAFCRPILCSR
jgi:hypothetical protein